MTPDDIIFPPYQGHCVNVSVINGANAQMLSSLLFAPASTDVSTDRQSMSVYSTLIESSHRSQRVLFDLAFPPNPSVSLPPSARAILNGDSAPLCLTSHVDVPDTLQAHGISLASINAIIWSHTHPDHTGDPSVFPPSTKLIGGFGFRAASTPGYPADPNSTVQGSAFRGRDVQEVSFDAAANTTTIGGFRAYDYFDDGSFFLMEAPGHTMHHICALARTTPDSWVFLGGDACHSAAQLRPSIWRPLSQSAAELEVNASLEGNGAVASRIEAFKGLAPGMTEDLVAAQRTLEQLTVFDGRDDVLVLLAHDASLLEVLDFFPARINEWKKNGWADLGRWLFLKQPESAAPESACKH